MSATPINPMGWWECLKHTGLLIAPARVRHAFPGELEPLPRFIPERLRRDLVRLESEATNDLGDLLDTVLEMVCGLSETGGAKWLKGSQVTSDWSCRTPAGDNVKPRRVWQAPHGGVLPVFVDPEPRLGVGRGRHSVARVLEWLRTKDLRLGLLTNGRQWRLIYAGTDHDASCEWDTDLWFAEGEPGPQVEALRRLVSANAWTPPAANQPCPLLAAILDSRKGQNELSAVLGERVRQAVELLIRSHSPALERLGDSVEQRDIYAAAVRTVMRLVIVLFAESRKLMPLDRSPLYFEHYSLTGLREQLEKEAARSAERLHHRRTAWPRVLALFRLVYEGCPHPDLAVPRYGGDLFAPGVADHADGLWRGLAIFEQACFDSRFAHVMSDAVVREILDKLSYSELTIRQGHGRIRTRVPVDFSDLQSEYIGILYEGLLDYELRRAGPDEPIVFLAIGDEPALPLSRLEKMDDKSVAALVEKFAAPASSGDDDGGGDEDSDDDAEDQDDAGDEDTEVVEDETAAANEVSTITADADPLQRARRRATAWARRAVVLGKLVRAARSKRPEAIAEYERKLDAEAAKLVRATVLPGQYYLVRWGGTRKGSGTFYTRPQLAVPTVHRTLRPLAYLPPTKADGTPDLDAPTSVWTPRKPEEILALKVCDPAVGSGSFPVAALRFLTEALYRALDHYGRLKEQENKTIVALAEGRPSEGRLDADLLPCRKSDPDFEPRLKARLRRYIVERCLYGVDLDPLATELARIALWIETMDRDLPFSFLDHKFRCGNSLVGCWFDQFRHYPVMAWERDGGDSTHSKGVHFKKDERSKAIRKLKTDRVRPALVDFIDGQGGLFSDAGGLTPEQVHAEAAKLLETMHSLRVDTEGELEKAERYAAWRASNSFSQLKLAFDAWCAMWFWPVEEIDAIPLPQSFAQLSEEAAEVVDQLARTHRFFHWELEFPDVFNAPGGGFSAMLGNPPWDISKPSSKEYFSNIDPLYRSYGKQEALAKQAEFFRHEEKIEREWLTYCGGFKAMSNWIDAAAHPFGDRVVTKPDGKQQHDFPLGGKGKTAFAESARMHRSWARRREGNATFSDPEHPFRHQGSADINLYKAFVELAHALLRPEGRLGFILPSGIYTDHGTTDLRSLLLDRCRWEWLFGFENRQKVFDIDSRFKFNPILVSKGGQTAAIRTAFMQHNVDGWELGAAERLAIPYTRQQVVRFSPKSKAILEIRSPRDLQVLEKIYANSVLLGDQGPNGWGITYAREFDMTNDSELFPPRPQWEERGYQPDEYSRWLKGKWRPIAELWDELKVPKSKRDPRPKAPPPYQSLPIPRADIPAGVILSRDCTEWIREDQIGTETVTVMDEDGKERKLIVPQIAVPLYQGVMVWQLCSTASDYVSGANHSAQWEPRSSFSPSLPLPQFLANRAHSIRLSPHSVSFRIGFRAIQNATNQRTFIASILPGCPAGNSLGVLHVATAHGGEIVVASATSFSTDAALRPRMSQANLNWFVVAEVPTLGLSQCSSSSLAVIESMVRSLICTSPSFAPRWFACTKTGLLRWRQAWACSNAERLRLRCILDAMIAALYGLSHNDLAWILRDCDYPVSHITNKTFARTLDAKGFWRVDKNQPPEIRHTVLTLVAFRDLERHIAAAGGNRDKGIEAFCQQNDGEGWMLPETLKLSDYGLGHDDRAREPQPVRATLGPRFFDWQLEQDADESWRECELHARNLLGAEGFKKLTAELESRTDPVGISHAATTIELTPKHKPDTAKKTLFD